MFFRIPSVSYMLAVLCWPSNNIMRIKFLLSLLPPVYQLLSSPRSSNWASLSKAPGRTSPSLLPSVLPIAASVPAISFVPPSYLWSTLLMVVSPSGIATAAKVAAAEATAHLLASMLCDSRLDVLMVVYASRIAFSKASEIFLHDVT